MNILRLAASALLSLISGAGLAAPVTIDGARIDFQVFAEGLQTPVVLATPPGDARIFVVEKVGTIAIYKDGTRQPGLFLDIRNLVSGDYEQGLLGLAFHPDFASNGKFYLDYTDTSGNTWIVEYRAEGDVADPQSGRVLLSIEQPFANHNGGWIGFGPDGLLYIAMGDGGAGGDPFGNGQNPNVLLAKILRIDVDGSEPYGIPAGNPYAQGGGAPEIFLSGVRNPWRNTFDGELFYIADVGQNAFEEINVVPLSEAAGANLGWNTMEGSSCFPLNAVCVQDGMVMPAYTYNHEDAGCSVTGGLVYRGKAIPELDGRYFFSDLCIGTLRSFRYADGVANDIVTGDLVGLEGVLGSVTGFGQDASGELYVLTYEGQILKMVRAD